MNRSPYRKICSWFKLLLLKFLAIYIYLPNYNAKFGGNRKCRVFFNTEAQDKLTFN